MTGPKSLIVIPARVDSGRFQRKLLCEHKGKTLLQWTWEAAIQCSDFANVVIAADEELFNLQPFEATWLKTSKHKNGTSRAYEAALGATALQADEGRQVIVWQADEPDIKVEDVARLSYYKGSEPFAKTMIAPLLPEEVENPNTVKAVINNSRCVRWFTRSSIPYASAHVGIYCFKSCAQLGQHCRLPIAPAAEIESLEQLTWLHYGRTVLAWLIDENPLSVNVPTDWIKFQETH